MKHLKANAAALFTWLSMAVAAQAQNGSLNIVGYYNEILQPGDNLIANQLLQQGIDNTLNNCLVGGVLAGSTFTLWDPVNNQLLPPSMFNGHTWSINYNWNPIDGMGGVIHSPSLATNTFVGEVYQNAS